MVVWLTEFRKPGTEVIDLDEYVQTYDFFANGDKRYQLKIEGEEPHQSNCSAIWN
jgi:hypothetical protein